MAESPGISPSWRSWLVATLLVGGLVSGRLVDGETSSPTPLPAPASRPAPVPAAAPSCEDAETCYREAVNFSRTEGSVTAGADGDLATKLNRLRVVMERHPGSLWAKRASLLSGLSLRDREPARALRYFRMAAKDFPLLDDYLRFWTAQALTNGGDHAEAAALFASIANAAPTSTIASRARYEAAESWVRAGHCDRAVGLFQQVLAEERTEAMLPSGYLHVADCQLSLNHPSDSREALARLWVTHPQAPEAQDAYLRLTKPGSDWAPSVDDRYQRGRALQAVALHEEAVEEFRQVLAMGGEPVRRGDVKYRLGLSLARLKRYDQAKTVFEDVTKHARKEAGEALVWLARVHLRQGDGEALLALTKRPPKVALTSPQRAMLAIIRGAWLEDDNRVEEAVTAYRTASRLGPSSQHHSEVLWKIGWAWYRAERWKEAREAFQRLASDRASESLVPQALYWMARASERLEASTAAPLYEQVCRSYPVTYYCQLARLRRPQLSEASLVPDPGPSASGQVRLAADKREEIGRDPAYRRAIELHLLGMEEEAAREVARLTQRYGRDPEVVLALSRLLSETGAYAPALRLARLHFRDELELRGQLDSPALWTVAYPTVFVPKAIAEGAVGVDPYLVSAVIREESQYDGRAVSRVGAIGLMQVMPHTASAVAKRLGLAEVTREDLFDEGTNVQIGVRYLEQLLNQFDGNVIYAVASYNAGPRAVSSWVDRNGQKEADEFVELIPYQETRLYVKRVVRSYREYLRLRSASPSSS